MVRVRAPQKTRQSIVDAAFEEIHHYGYQGCSLDRILKRAKVTKGALYHHFASKAALGVAVIDEVIEAYLHDQWGVSLEEHDDPVQCMIDRVREVVSQRTVLEFPVLGLPLSNFVQEMAPLDKTFLLRIRGIFSLWQELIEKSLKRGQENGKVRSDIDIEDAAIFLVSAYEGITSLVRAAQSVEMLLKTEKALINHLESLKPPK